jgi:uncharacterized protein (TIGR02680 family)
MTRFHPNRLGFFNFWYHSDSEFEFSSGKLFIRGKNGSGKTITTTMGVPVLIDGNKRANRLDPMGSRDRHMIDLLLGERSISGRKESIGYIYFEYKNGDQYITTGIGMHGFRDSGRLNNWYFILSDGRRIGRDIYLYDEEWSNGSLQKVVKNKQTLKDVLGTNSFFTESQEEYMEEVNRQLFGFPDVKMFRDLVELLLNLRSPKLSRDLKPGVVNDILSRSLNELTEKELDPLTETIDIIDKHEARLHKTKQEIEILTSLCNAYNTYTQYIAYTVARETNVAQDKESALRTNIIKLEAEIGKFHNEIEDATSKFNQMTAERDALNQEKQGFQNNSLFDKLQTNREKLKESDEKLSDLENRITTRGNAYKDAKEKWETVSSNLSETKNIIFELLEELKDTAEETHFSDHDRQVGLFENSNDHDPFPFTSWVDLIKEYSNQLNDLRVGFNELARLNSIEREKRDEKEAALETVNKLEHTLHDLEERLEVLRSEFHEDLLSWVENTAILSVTNDEKAKLRTIINYLFLEEDNLINIRIWMNNIQERRIQEVKDKAFNLKKEKEAVSQDLKFAEDKKHVLEETGEVFPDLTLGKESQSELLRNAKIPHGRFYELVEFQESVPENIRSALEFSIVQVGLLDTIIVNPEDEVEAKKIASITLTKPRKEDNLTSYLTPISSNGIYDSTIRSVLEGISVRRHEEGYILDNGEFSGGWSQGTAANTHYCYIGKEARVRLRDIFLDELEETITDCNNRIVMYTEETRRLDFEVEEIKSAASQMPMPVQMKCCYLETKDAEPKLAASKGNLNIRNEAHSKAESEYTQFKQNMQERTRHLPFGMDGSVYDYILKRCDDYASALSDLRVKRERLENLTQANIREKEVYDTFKISLEEAEEEAEQEKLNVRNATLAINMIQEQLRKEGLQDIAEQIETIDQRLEDLNNSILTVSNAKAAAISLKEQKEQAKEGVLTQLLKLEKLVRAWEAKFHEEKQKGSIPSDSTPKEAVIHMQPTFQDLQRTDLEIKLSEQFYRAQHDLHDYKPDMYKENGMDIGPEQEDDWLSLREKTTRLVLTFTVDYKKITSNTLLSERTQQRISDEQLIEAEEKDLYKKVLIDDIGTTVVQRIHNVRDWTIAINDMLSNMSTNIKIQLRWDPLPGKNGSLSTKQLVDILSRDSDWIIDDDIVKVSKHFRSQIEDARTLAKGDTQLSLKDKIRDIMDYRKWFVFTIRSQKGDEDGFSDLTDSVFNTYSNGEKAMSIYMPLFAAIAAKYKDARSTAPRLISLDEAFAGVDADNTAQLFQLAHQLDFDYIMNAFGLWGCYESVDTLSIIEIVRPISSPTLGLVKYHWDGKKRYRFPTGESLETNLPNNV